MDNDVIDTDTDTDTGTQITVEWYAVEVTTYRRTFDIGDLELDKGETTASVLASIAAGQTPYIDTDCLVDYETDENERAYDCNDRSIVTVSVGVELCDYPQCGAPWVVRANDHKLCAEHGARYIA
jgi:hypothetical protein